MLADNSFDSLLVFLLGEQSRLAPWHPGTRTGTRTGTGRLQQSKSNKAKATKQKQQSKSNKAKATKQKLKLWASAFAFDAKGLVT